MIQEEYNRLKRFPVDHQISFEEFNKTLRLSKSIIFECYTLSDSIRYLRINDSFGDAIFDIIECSSDGQSIRYPYKRGSTRKEEIAERLWWGAWRVISIHLYVLALANCCFHFDKS